MSGGEKVKEPGYGDYLSAAGEILGGISSALGDASRYKAQAANLQFSAKEQRRQAGEAATAAQIESYEARQKAALALSRVQAVAAAQGSTVDANTLRLIADFETEGRLSALAAMYEGSQKSHALLASAANAEYEAAAQRKAAKKSKHSVFGSLLGSVAGFVLSGGNPAVAAGAGKVGGALGGMA